MQEQTAAAGPPIIMSIAAQKVQLRMRQSWEKGFLLSSMPSFWCINCNYSRIKQSKNDKHFFRMSKTSIFVLGVQLSKFQVLSWIKIFDKSTLLVLHFSDSLVVTPGVGQYLTPLGLSRISLNPQATLLWLRSIWFSIHISCFEMGARFPVFVFIFSEFVSFSSFLSVATLKQLSFRSAGDTVLI